jgi:hypothetical protein
MDNQTKRFKEKIQESKESDASVNEQAEQIVKSYGSVIAIVVGLCQLSSIYLAYYILSTKIPSMIYLNYWEGMGILLGVFSLFTIFRNHLKTIFNK